MAIYFVYISYVNNFITHLNFNDLVCMPMKLKTIECLYLASLTKKKKNYFTNLLFVFIFDTVW